MSWMTGWCRTSELSVVRVEQHCSKSEPNLVTAASRLSTLNQTQHSMITNSASSSPHTPLSDKPSLLPRLLLSFILSRDAGAAIVELWDE